ncbi:MAG TPA: ribonuclease D [Myxococcota bacterium]|nr:ribonuclease D [Myxococcota bacterium]
MADYHRIETRADLEALAQELLGEDVVAFDTEADSFYHYFDKTCLVQIATRRQIYLVDPLAFGGPAELAPLAPVFADPDIRKIFHAAEYDIFVLKRDGGFRFAGLFDTMVCAQLLGYPSIGLQALVERHFDVSLPKDEQRSDWSARPLTQNQLDYAAADVVYLIALAEKLERELEQAGRTLWAQEEFALLCQREWPDRQFDELGYLRIKGARGIDRTSLAVLRELYLMRDARAREIDRPPFKVLGNRTLLEIAERQPHAIEELSTIKGVTDLILRRLGREVLAAVARGRKSGHGPIPKTEGPGRRRMDRRSERIVSALKRWRSERAAALGLDPGVLCPNSTLEAIAIERPATVDELRRMSEVKGWFGREFGAEVAGVLKADRAEDAAGTG